MENLEGGQPTFYELEAGPKKIYVSGRVRDMDQASSINGLLKEQGHTVTYDWTEAFTTKPFLDHLEANRIAAENMRKGAMEANVFILIWDPNLLGALQELGMFLATSTPENPKMAYIVGNKDRESLFDTLPEVKLRKHFAEVLDELRF